MELVNFIFVFVEYFNFYIFDLVLPFLVRFCMTNDCAFQITLVLLFLSLYWLYRYIDHYSAISAEPCTDSLFAFGTYRESIVVG